MIRTTLIPHHKKVMLTIPEEYIGTPIEVIAFPAEKNFLEKQQLNVKSAIQSWLLQSPTWSDEEYANYLQAREHFNQERKK
ncbi:MAG: hypothetical protein LBB31_01020 [Prevotellaceae bacterium]|jgi:hypothetical protein|nr:hypothetical protein [Prevotellaceae bacterium]